MTHEPDLRRVSAQVIQIIAATKVVNEDTGEPVIAVGIGESIEQSEFLVMSIRDARWSGTPSSELRRSCTRRRSPGRSLVALSRCRASSRNAATIGSHSPT